VVTFATKEQALKFVAAVSGGIDSRTVIIPTTHGHWVIVSVKEACKPVKTCSICGEWFREYPCNAQPVNNGRCCAYCDDHIVTPARIELMKR